MPLIKRKIRAKSDKPDTLVSPEAPNIEIATAPNELVPEENYDTVGIIDGLDEGVDTRALPKPRGKTLDFLELMDYLASLTTEHWKHTIAYVYRLYPICDAKINNPDAPTSIGKISQSLTTRQFVDMYGGGKYKIIVNDVDIIKNKHRDLKGNHRTVCYSVFNIKWTDFDPILNPSELIIDDPRNKPFLTYWISKGKLNEDYSMVTSQQPSSEIIGFMRDLLDRMDRSNKQVLDTIQRNASNGNSDASKLIDLYQAESGKREELMLRMMEGKGGPEQLQMILSLLKEIRPAETGMNGQLEMFRQMMAMQEENRKSQMDLMMKLFERNNNPGEEKKEPKTLLEQLEEAKSVMDMLGGGGKRTTTEVVVDTVKEIAANIGPYVMQYVMAKQGVAMGVIPQVPVNNNPTVVSHQAPQLEQPDMKTMAKQFIAQYGNILIMQIDQQKSGAELADLVIEMFGMDGYVNIKSFGKQNIIDAAKSNPAFWQRIVVSAGTEEEVNTFINEFFDPPKEDEEEEGGIVQ